jgi:hypothetical protein
MVKYKNIFEDISEYLEDNGYNKYDVSGCYDSIIISDVDSVEELSSIIEDYEYDFDSTKESLEIDITNFNNGNNNVVVDISIIENKSSLL